MCLRETAVAAAARPVSACELGDGALDTCSTSETRPPAPTYDTFMRGIDWSTHVAGRHYVMAASTPAIHRFLAEIERTTGHNIRWLPSMHNGTYDPLADWVVEQLDRSHGLWQPDVGQPREPVPETFP